MATLTPRQCDKYPENWSDWVPSVSPFVPCSWNNYDGSNTKSHKPQRRSQSRWFATLFFPSPFGHQPITDMKRRRNWAENLEARHQMMYRWRYSLCNNFIPNQLLRGRKAALEKQREEKRRGALSRSVPEDSGVIVWPNKRHKRQPKSILGLVCFLRKYCKWVWFCTNNGQSCWTRKRCNEWHR